MYTSFDVYLHFFVESIVPKMLHIVPIPYYTIFYLKFAELEEMNIVIVLAWCRNLLGTLCPTFGVLELLRHHT